MIKLAPLSFLRLLRQSRGMKSLQILACSIALLIPVAASVNAGPLDSGAYKTRPGYTPAPSTPPVELQQLLTEGQAALLKGDTSTAKTDFEWALQLDPHNKTAIGYMRKILLLEAQQNKGAALEKQLAGLTIPKLRQVRSSQLHSIESDRSHASHKLPPLWTQNRGNHNTSEP